MSANQELREDILETFQSITGIDDVGESILHLEESNWDLLAAVTRVLPQEHSEPSPSPYDASALNNLNMAGSSSNQNRSLPSPSTLAHRNIFESEAESTTHSNSNANDNNSQSLHAMEEFIDVIEREQTPTTTESATRSDDSHTPKDLKFNIHHNFMTHIITVRDTITIGDLKIRIFEVTGIPVCRQSWCGWVQSMENCDDATELHTMDLSDEYELIVSDVKDLKGPDYVAADENQTIHRLSGVFKLNVLIESSNITMQLNFPGAKTVLDVKNDLYDITNIAVRHQQWDGWPEAVENTTVLALTGVPLEHNLVLRSIEGEPDAVAADAAQPIPNHTHGESSTARPNSNRTSASNAAVDSASGSASGSSGAGNGDPIEVDSDSSVDEFEDASDFNGDDELFSAQSSNRRVRHLIPDGTDNETSGSMQFIDNYKARYGEPCPRFFGGSLEEALSDACHRPVKDRKLLAIYLHHDKSVLSNVFCDRLMKCDTIMQTLEHNFVLYGWDLTFESNKNLFLSSLSACAGSTALMHVRTLPNNRLPAILVIGKTRSICEVLSVIYGNVSADELLNKLIDVIKLFSDQRDVELREEDERAARELVKMEQDAAYHESLEADRRKEEAKKQKEHAIATERRRLESERQEIEMVREMNRLEAERSLPPEPEPGTPAITQIRIRKPSGEYMERRFLVTDQLHTLLMFITSKGFPTDEYKVISSWPRRDLTTLEKADSLEVLKLCPQETVSLEER